MPPKMPGVEVRLSSLEHSTLFLVNKVHNDKETQAKYAELDQRLDRLCRFVYQEYYAFKPTIGEIIGVYLPNEGVGKWVRGRIVDCYNRIEGSKYKILLIDVGGYVETTTSHMVQLNETMKDYPPQFFRVGLDGVIPQVSLSKGHEKKLADVFNRGPAYFVQKKEIGNVAFGDILIQQEIDQKIVNLTTYLLTNKVVKRTEDFEKEARQFYGFRKEEKDQASDTKVDQTSPPSTSQVQEKCEKPTGRSGKETGKDKAHSKDTGYSSSDDQSEAPFVRDDAIFVPAGYQCNSTNKKDKKSSSHREEPCVKVPKTYYQILKEKHLNVEKPSRCWTGPKEEYNSFQPRSSTREKSLQKQQRNEDKELQLEKEDEIPSQSVFKSKRVSFGEPKHERETRSPSSEDQSSQKKHRSFNLNFKSEKRNCNDKVSLANNLKQNIVDKEPPPEDIFKKEVNAPRKEDSSENVDATVSSNKSNANLSMGSLKSLDANNSSLNKSSQNNSNAINSSINSSGPNNSSAISSSISNSSLNKSSLNNSNATNNMSSGSSNTSGNLSGSSKRKIISMRLKHGLAVQEIVKSCIQENNEELVAEKSHGSLKTSNSNLSFSATNHDLQYSNDSTKVTTCLPQENTEDPAPKKSHGSLKTSNSNFNPSSTDHGFQNSNESVDRTNSSMQDSKNNCQKDKKSDISEEDPLETLNQNTRLDSEIGSCNLINRKRKMISDKLKKEKAASRKEHEANQKEPTDSSSQSHSVCSEDSNDSYSKRLEKQKLLRKVMASTTEVLDKSCDDVYVSSTSVEEHARRVNVAAGVLVHTEDDQMVQPALTLADSFLDQYIVQALERRGRRELNRIQKYSYPTITARHNIAMISPRRSGKTCGYVVPLCSNLLDQDFYLKLPRGNGPRALVITPCWETGAITTSEFRSLTSFVNVIHTYGGGAEVELKIDLLKGCDILVSTPKCILRLLEYGITDLKRLCHFVMDDADILFDKFKLEMEKLIVQIDMMERAREKKALDMQLQVVVTSRTWTPPLEELVTCILTNPTICISSQLEACVYSSIKPLAIFVDSSKKIEKLFDILKEVEGKKRTVVMCRSKADVKFVYRLLIDLGVKNVIAAHEDLSGVSLSEVPGLWNKVERNVLAIWNESYSLPILIRSDEILEEVPITNASMLIHYNMPCSKKTFSLRFICLLDNYRNMLQKERSYKKPEVVIMLDEKNDLEMPGVMEFMKRLGTVLPDSVLETLEKIDQLNEQKKLSKPLCENVKEFGQCWNMKSCPSRHIVDRELDFPNNVPRTGWVKIMVQYVHDICHYSARLLEHAHKKDEWKRLQSDLLILSTKLNNHYSKMSNRRLHGHPSVGDMVAMETSVGVFQRAVVIRIAEHNKYNEPIAVDVRLIDNGRYNYSVRVTELYHLSEELKAPPPSVVDVYLCGLRPKDLDTSWPPALKAWVELRLKEARGSSPDGYLVGKITLAIGSNLWLEPVEYLEYLPLLETTVFHLSLRKNLLETNNATENNDHIPALHKLCEKACLDLPEEEKLRAKKPVQPKALWAWLPQDQCESVHVIVVQDPDVIFLRRNQFSDCLEKLVAEIQEYMKKQKVKDDCKQLLEVGDVCLGKPSGSEEWNRAVIKSKPCEDTVELFFADYGDTDVLSWNDVAPISNRLITKLPFQVIECYLAGVKYLPSEGKDWEDDVVDLIYNLTRNDQEEALSLLVKVCGVESKAMYTSGKRYKVVLSNCDVDPMLFINKELISSEFADCYEEDEKFFENFEKSDLVHLRSDDSEKSESRYDQVPSSSNMEVVPVTQNVDCRDVVLSEEFNVEEKTGLEVNELKVMQFLKDLEEGDFDCSIFHGIENDADISDNTSEASGLSLPHSRGSIPRSSAPLKQLPPPACEDSLSSTSETISSSQHGSTMSLNQGKNILSQAEFSREKNFSGSSKIKEYNTVVNETTSSSQKEDRCEILNQEYLESVQCCEPAAFSSPKNELEVHEFECNLSSVNQSSSLHLSGSHSVSFLKSDSCSRITGIANSFKDLISPSFFGSSKSSNPSSKPSLIEKVSPYLKHISQFKQFPIDEDEMDSTMAEMDNTMAEMADVCSKSVSYSKIPQSENFHISTETGVGKSEISSEDIEKYVDQSGSGNVNDFSVSIIREQKSITSENNVPGHKWVEGKVNSDTDDSQSFLSQNSTAVEATTEGANVEVRTPLVVWHQNENFVWIHIKLPAVSTFDFNSDYTSFNFSAIYGEVPYKVSLELFGGHKPEAVQCASKACYFEIRLEKLLKGNKRRSYWPRLTKSTEKLHWLKLNAEKACEDLEESEDDDVKRLACSLPLWNENPVDSESCASSELSEVAHSELSLE